MVSLFPIIGDINAPVTSIIDKKLFSYIEGANGLKKNSIRKKVLDVDVAVIGGGMIPIASEVLKADLILTFKWDGSEIRNDNYDLKLLDCKQHLQVS